MNIIENIYDSIKHQNDIHRTTKICLSTDAVIFKVLEFPITNPSLFQNENLQIKLIVKNENYYVDWILMKKSTINEAGFGLFALRYFEVDEMISVYLGEKVKVNEKVDYVFKDVNGRPEYLDQNGLLKEFWLAHRINHGMYEQVNADIRTDYKIIAVKDIKKGEEIFLDYNRDVLCLNCYEENCFVNNTIMDCHCSDCKEMGRSNKHCSICDRYICIKCYYKSQIGNLIL